MSAPERIWACTTDIEPRTAGQAHISSTPDGDATEYRRADLPPTDAEVMAHPTVKALVEAANDMCLIAERDEWHKAMTGRQIILRNLRAALAAIQEAKP